VPSPPPSPDHGIDSNCAASTQARPRTGLITRERVPLDWAMTQANLALALRAQAERSRDAALMAQALAAIDGAIEEFTKRDAPDTLDKARRNRERVLATARDLGCS
jgi:hypothetical protein